jgi:hypothetical protein
VGNAKSVLACSLPVYEIQPKSISQHGIWHTRRRNRYMLRLLRYGGDTLSGSGQLLLASLLFLGPYHFCGLSEGSVLETSLDRRKLTMRHWEKDGEGYERKLSIALLMLLLRRCSE